MRFASRRHRPDHPGGEPEAHGGRNANHRHARQKRGRIFYLSFVLPEGRKVITNSLSLEVVRSCKQTNKPKSLCVALATVQLRNRQFHLHRTDRARATSARLGVFLWKAPGGACNWGASSSRPSYAVEERAQPLPPTPSARSHHENIPILPIQQCPHPRLKSEGGPAVFSSRVACRVDGVPPGIRANTDAGHQPAAEGHVLAGGLCDRHRRVCL